MHLTKLTTHAKGVPLALGFALQKALMESHSRNFLMCKSMRPHRSVVEVHVKF
jgi:hypothetical protein